MPKTTKNESERAYGIISRYCEHVLLRELMLLRLSQSILLRELFLKLEMFRIFFCKSAIHPFVYLCLCVHMCLCCGIGNDILATGNDIQKYVVHNENCKRSVIGN